MSDGSRLARAHEGSPAPAPGTEPMPPSVGDLLRYLWARRVRLMVSFAALAGIGASVLLAWWLFGQRSARATLALTFRGIERHEYPSGKEFAIEDIRSPRVLERALDDLGVPPERRDLQALYRGIDLTPIVPVSVLERWKKQDRDGAKREEYLPSEFALDVHPKGYDDAERVRLLYALLRAYQRQVRQEQEAELQRVTKFSTLPADQLVAAYDYWDLPILLRLHAEAVAARLAQLIRESEDFRDPALNLSFRDVSRDLEAWTLTRLEALAALVHRERLVKDREAMRNRLDERLANLEIDLRRLNGEAEETTRLLEVVDQPKAVLARQLQEKEGAPLVDVAALEKLVKSDYIGPVVRRVSELREQAASVAARKERVQREIALLEQAGQGAASRAPEGFTELVAGTVRDLDRIVESHLRVLDAYLEAAVTSRVTLREGPYLRLKGPELRLVAVAVVFVAALLALLLVLASDSLGGGPREER